MAKKIEIQPNTNVTVKVKMKGGVPKIDGYNLSADLNSLIAFHNSRLGKAAFPASDKMRAKTDPPQ